MYHHNVLHELNDLPQWLCFEVDLNWELARYTSERIDSMHRYSPQILRRCVLKEFRGRLGELITGKLLCFPFKWSIGCSFEDTNHESLLLQPDHGCLPLFLH